MWDSGRWKEWRLVVKLDPDKHLPRESVDLIRQENIDAVVVGGTQGINYRNTSETVRLVREAGFKGTLVQEISSADAVVPWVDAHLIPLVLNAGEKRWLVDAQLGAIKMYGNLINWDRVLVEGYLVGNLDSAVGRLTGALPLAAGEAAAYTILAEEIYRLPVLYLEYSGVFGDLDLVREVAGARRKIHLVYGGGIKTPQQAGAVASLVDTVVIGNIIYEDPALAGEVIRSFSVCRGPVQIPGP